MPSTYTVNLGIEKPATGEQSGTWGDTTNVNFDILDQAVNGAARVTLTSAGTSGSPNTLAITNGATSDGRNKWVEFYSSSDLGGNVFVQLDPNDAEKIVFVRNSLGGSQSVILFQGTYDAGRDLEIPAGMDMVVKFDGGGATATTTNVFQQLRTEALNVTGTVDAGTVEFDNLSGTGAVSVTNILDEDNMASNSATALSTQQSIKAYVDSQVTAQDLDFGGDSGTGAVDLDSQTFTIAGTANEIETSASGQTLTVGLPDNVTIAGNLTVDTDTLYVDSANNRVGINESTPLEALHITTSDSGTTINKTVGSTSGPVLVLDNTDDTTNNLAAIQFASSGSSSAAVIATTGIYSINTGRGGTYSYGDLAFYTTGSGGSHDEAMRIDSSQRVLIGLSSARTNFNNGATTPSALQIEGTVTSSQASITANRNDVGGPLWYFGKTRGTAVGSNTVVQDDDQLGGIVWQGADGTDLVSAAQIRAYIDGAPGNNDMPGRIEFSTTSDAGISPTERMRISSGGQVNIGDNMVVYSGPNLQIRSQDNTAIGAADIWSALNKPGIDVRNSSNTLFTYAGINFFGGTSSNSYAGINMVQTTANSKGALTFWTGGNGEGSPYAYERMRIASDGIVGINTTSSTAQAFLQINGGADGSGILTGRTDGGNGNNERFVITGFADGGGANYGGGIGFQTRNTTNTFIEAMRIDSSQRVLIGYTANTSVADHNAALQIVGQGTADYHGATTSIIGFSNNSNGAYLNFGSGRSNTAGTYTIVANDDTVGQINFAAADGTDMASRAAFINVNIDGAPGANDTPGRLTFHTTADGASSPTERMRISNDGNIVINTVGAKLYFQNSSGPAPYIQNAGTNNSDLTIATNGSEAMRITAAGDVELNTPNSGVGLFINNTTHDSVVQIQASGANKNSVIRFADGDDADVGLIDYDHADNTLDITTNALTNGLEISGTKGIHAWKTFENWGTGNYNLTMAPGVVFQRKGTIADDIKIRVFQGGYTYSGGSIEFVIRKGGGTQNSVGSGVIYFNGRESENNHVIVGYNDSDQIVVNSDTYAGTYADGKFTFAIRSTNGDSHITVMNRLGSEVNMALKFNILYTG